MPAASALLRNVVLPRNPVVVFVEAKLNGFGLFAARNPRNVEFEKFALVYAAGLPALAAFTPWKNPRNVGSGLVPVAPVKANVLPLPAAMLACRFACAVRNSFRKPLLVRLTWL